MVSPLARAGVAASAQAIAQPSFLSLSIGEHQIVTATYLLTSDYEVHTWRRESGNVPLTALNMPFAEDSDRTADYSGNGNTASLVNLPAWAPTGGHDGYGAYDLEEATGSHISVADSASLDISTNLLTLAIWFKAEDYVSAASVYRGLFCKGSTESLASYALAWDSENPSGDDSIRLFLNSGALEVKTATGSLPFDTGWHRIVAVYDGSLASNTVRIYIDGALQTLTYLSGTSTYSTNLTPNNDALLIGRSGTGRNFDGIVDGVMVSGDLAWSDGMAAADWNSGSGNNVIFDASREASGAVIKCTATPITSGVAGPTETATQDIYSATIYDDSGDLNVDVSGVTLDYDVYHVDYRYNDGTGYKSLAVRNIPLGGADDISRDEETVTYSGTDLVADSPYSGGYSILVTEGQSDYARCPFPPGDIDYPATVAIWFKYTGSATDGLPISLAQSNSSVNVYGFRIETANGNPTVYSRRAGYKEDTGTGDYRNAWHHAVCVFRNVSDYEMWVDGVSVVTATQTTTENLTAMDRLGFGYAADSSPTYGGTTYLADCQLYDYEVSAGQRAYLASVANRHKLHFSHVVIGGSYQARVEFMKAGASVGTLTTNELVTSLPDILEIAELTLWLDGTDSSVVLDGGGSPVVDNGVITTWVDKSGNGLDFVSTNSPVYQHAALNGRHVIYLGSNGYFTGDFSGLSLTGAEIFVVHKVDSETNRGFWYFGSSATRNHYPYSGRIYDSFGSSVRINTGNPAQALTAYHAYNVTSVAGEWTSRINGAQHYTTATNTVGFASAPIIGKSIDSWYLKGHVAEVIMYNRGLSPSERLAVGNYLSAKWGI